MKNPAKLRPSSELFMRFGPTLVVVLMVALSLTVPAWRWGLALSLPLLALAIYDFAQRRHSLWRNYPILAHIRWIAEDLRPFAQAYFVESDTEGRPFNHNERALVYARSK
ncbi:MAG: FMN-binding glutamate synthase family protein, partial [Pseudomonadota bacterium]|nr:FMN-binding glutamate synthase family protein [Pseudomonadota bacterium]